MHGHSISKFNFLNIFNTIHSFFIIKANINNIVCTVNTCKYSYIPVKNSRAVFAVLKPRNIIIIFNLHNLIAFTQGIAFIFNFVFFVRRRIKLCLQKRIYIFSSNLTFTAWAKHLNIPYTVKPIA